jgi:nitroreductase
MRKHAANAKRAVHLGLAYLSLFKALYYDNLRYCRHALIGWSRYRPNLDQFEAQIIKLYHVIEKGLGMPDFRPRFGELRVRDLLNLMQRFLDLGGDRSNRHYGSALRCLEAYEKVHKELGIDVSDILPETQIRALTGSIQLEAADLLGGVDEVGEVELFSQSDSAFANFAPSRRSCRTFDPLRPVPHDLIDRAVKIAIHTPSVCNRQAWKVHAYHDRETIDRLLSFQNGNVGFGHRIPCLLVVTADLHCFDGVIERYQPWIDGGMFSMTLLFALHHFKVGAVPLNWSVEPAADQGLRKAAELSDSESVIMLVGVGYPTERMYIPVSQRRSLSEVLKNHTQR